MSKDAIFYKINKQTSDTNSTADSWSIKLNRKKRYMTIESLDYHAGPLVLSRDELVGIARNMGLHVRTRKRKNNGSPK